MTTFSLYKSVAVQTNKQDQLLQKYSESTTNQNKILYVVKQVITCSWLVFEIDVAKLVLYI